MCIRCPLLRWKNAKLTQVGGSKVRNGDGVGMRDTYWGWVCVMKRRKDWREEGEHHASLRVFTNPARVLDQYYLFVSFEVAWPVHFCFYQTWTVVRGVYSGQGGFQQVWRVLVLEGPELQAASGLYPGAGNEPLFKRGSDLASPCLKPRRPWHSTIWDVRIVKFWCSGPEWVKYKYYDHNNILGKKRTLRGFPRLCQW